MDLGNLTGHLAAREPLFWVAAGTLALGAACLAAALAMLLSRLRPSGRRAIPAAALGAPGPQPADRYEPAAFAPPPPAAAPGTDPEPSLALLLRRLQAAGDRLDDIAADLEAAAAAADESGLKDLPAGVEYVFRASGA
jgi:hypothetical protein